VSELDSRFRGHFLKGRYDVHNGGRHTSPAAPPGQQLAEVTAVAEHQVADDDQAPAIPSASRVRLIGQPERGAFMRTKNQLRYEISRSSLQPIAQRNQNRADVPREERKWYG